jgi:hypothetical protein
VVADGHALPFIGNPRICQNEQLVQSAFSNEDRAMKRFVLSAALLGGSAALCVAAEFESPVRLKAGETPIRVESPGYACPGWAVINGQKTLLVGQFNQGKIQVFKHLGGEKFAPGTWLQAEGKVAEIPGVW